MTLNIFMIHSCIIKNIFPTKTQGGYFIHDEIFNVDIPKEISDCPSDILNPKDTWKDENAYDEQAKKLAKMFKDNFEKKYPDMPDNIKSAGPKA